MLIHRGYKYRILPTKEQEESLLQCGGNTRFLWNYVLKINQDYYKETGKFKFYHELAVSLPKLKEEYPSNDGQRIGFRGSPSSALRKAVIYAEKMNRLTTRLRYGGDNTNE